ncbi:hypothetical protein Turpa_3421 [Turneriella parva DSM 21527]|uniref:Uncharacterized protein n=1 Tax=Turneriella parva (strain ATCC BAA-1111 / DSM 21527 / NCTC 11395 / H) TaxID=869212 RepID=I4B9V1_TURPD|nr:hypothetical protein Turpa_3421 [Turneriella parva DSM 21527]
MTVFRIKFRFNICFAIMADNVDFTLTFLLVASSSQAKMCPKRLPEPANAGPLAGGRRASLARSGRARDPTKWSRAQQVKFVVRWSWAHGGLFVRISIFGLS